MIVSKKQRSFLKQGPISHASQVCKCALNEKFQPVSSSKALFPMTTYAETEVLPYDVFCHALLALDNVSKF